MFDEKNMVLRIICIKKEETVVESMTSPESTVILRSIAGKYEEEHQGITVQKHNRFKDKSGN